MRRTIWLLLLACGVAACGTFNLGIVRPQAGKTSEQQQLDTLTCKDQANLAANTTGRQTGDFLLGMTIIGAPVAFEREKAKERAVFAECMTARGYAVTPADGSAPTTPTTPAAEVPVPLVAPIPGSDQLAIDLPTGFVFKTPPDSLKSQGVVLYGLNHTLDIGVLVLPVRHDGVTDLAAFAATTKANQSDRLKDTTSSQVSRLEIGNHHAARFSVTGTFGKVKLTYVTTLVEGAQEIVIVNAWTGATNAVQQMPLLEGLAGQVSGIL